MTTASATNATTHGAAKEPCHPVLYGIAKDLQATLPDELWDDPSRSFFVTFWSLSLGDLHVPMSSYEEEVNRLKNRITAISNDRHDLSIAGTQRKDREKKALNELQERLRAELKTRIAYLTVSRKRLALEKDLWFAGQTARQNALNTALLEQCFLPRILFSPVDALYSFRMFKHLHSSGTKNFWSMGFLDQIFAEKRLTSILFLCTAKEAESLGGFLNEILRDLKKWHADKAIFEKEAYGAKQELPGFCTKRRTIKRYWSYFHTRLSATYYSSGTDSYTWLSRPASVVASICIFAMRSMYKRLFSRYFQLSIGWVLNWSPASLSSLRTKNERTSKLQRRPCLEI